MSLCKGTSQAQALLGLSYAPLCLVYMEAAVRWAHLPDRVEEDVDEVGVLGHREHGFLHRESVAATCRASRSASRGGAGRRAAQ